METIGERIKKLRTSDELNLTLEKFGERVGVTKTAISKIEKNERNTTDQMFKSICREFNVNPEWLRNGTGDMFLELDEDGIIAGWVGKVLKDKPKSFRKNVISVMSTWTEEDWDWIERQANAIIAESKKGHD
ncbi:XRE family transcriptional regulator [bacterium D16-36]|nr:XRE family transcriptional regulator [bacterium D16-36]